MSAERALSSDVHSALDENWEYIEIYAACTVSSWIVSFILHRHISSEIPFGAIFVSMEMHVRYKARKNETSRVRSNNFTFQVYKRLLRYKNIIYNLALT